EPLRFTTAQGWAGLAELQVPQAGFDEQGEWLRDFLIGAKEFRGLRDRHLHDVADAAVVIEHLEGLRVVTLPAAILARHVTAWKETHLQFEHALTAAGLAT